MWGGDPTRGDNVAPGTAVGTGGWQPAPSGGATGPVRIEGNSGQSLGATREQPQSETRESSGVNDFIFMGATPFASDCPHCIADIYVLPGGRMHRCRCGDIFCSERCAEAHDRSGCPAVLPDSSDSEDGDSGGDGPPPRCRRRVLAELS